AGQGAQRRQQGVGQDPRLREVDAALGSLQHGDALEDVLLRLGFDTAHPEQPVGAGRLLESVDAENAQRVVDVLGGPRSQAGNAGQPQQGRWYLRLEAGQELQLSGGDVFDDLFLDRLTDAGDVLQPSLFDEVLDLGGQVVQLADRFPVGADLEEVLAADLEQIRNPVQHGRDVGIPHVSNLAGDVARRRPGSR